MTFNNICHAGVVALALCLAACGGPNTATAISAAVASPPTAGRTQPQRAGTATKAAPGTKRAEFVAGTLCVQPDQVVFSCPLEKTNKIVSICAAGNTAPHRFYYAFGKANAPELVYPTEAEENVKVLNRTYLTFAGGTGGYAFSFHNAGFEYITYSVSGQGTDAGGVLVRYEHADLAKSQFECDNSSTIESKDDELIRESLRLKPESDLLSGLPQYSAGRKP